MLAAVTLGSSFLHDGQLIKEDIAPVARQSSATEATCRDSLLYKGSEDDVGLGLEVTGWVWNKMKSTKAMMIATRRKVSCSMLAVRLRLVG